MKILTSLISLCLAGLASCQQGAAVPEQADWNDVKSTWSGAAEINRYDLKQERYGDIIDGVAMLIYVREPFLKNRQVKDESGKGDFQVLKLNATREFRTGVYPYHTLVSVFHPLENTTDNMALKVTTSVQEWCGHVFVQTNRKDGHTITEVKSYFEAEDGARHKEKASVLLEDEVWTALRINPNQLPVGNIKMIAGSLASRFSHTKQVAEEVTTRWIKGNSDKSIIYEIFYIKSGRKLAIEISQSLPYSILGWHESGEKGLLSSAKLKKQLHNVDYWNYKDDPKGKKLRKKLGLN
ncbi:MAG: septum formation inhibitor Maf [Akkermansiaceae bacterium]